MTVIPSTLIRSRSAATPTHTTASGRLHLNTATGEIWKQIQDPVGAKWRKISGATIQSFGDGGFSLITLQSYDGP